MRCWRVLNLQSQLDEIEPGFRSNDPCLLSTDLLLFTLCSRRPFYRSCSSVQSRIESSTRPGSWLRVGWRKLMYCTRRGAARSSRLLPTQPFLPLLSVGRGAGKSEGERVEEIVNQKVLIRKALVLRHKMDKRADRTARLMKLARLSNSQRRLPTAHPTVRSWCRPKTAVNRTCMDRARVA